MRPDPRATQPATFAAPDGSAGWQSAGFTLLEVLVALAIVAIALSALIKAGSENTVNAAYLRDKTLAHWVAMNTITDMHVRNAWPSPGETEDTAVMGTLGNTDREWDWTATVEETPDPTVRRVTVEVRPKDSDTQPLARLVGFLQQPIQATGVAAPGNGTGSDNGSGSGSGNGSGGSAGPGTESSNK